MQLDKLNRNFFVVMAHVEQNSGLLKEFDGGRIIDLGSDPLFPKTVIGFQKMKTNDLKDTLNTCIPLRKLFVAWKEQKSTNIKYEYIDDYLLKIRSKGRYKYVYK
jgi:hypothetical protein